MDDRFTTPIPHAATTNATATPMNAVSRNSNGQTAACPMNVDGDVSMSVAISTTDQPINTIATRSATHERNRYPPATIAAPYENTMVDKPNNAPVATHSTGLSGMRRI